MKRIIQKADLIGPSIGFEEEGSSLFTTFIGSIVTLIIVVAIIVIGFLFGKEVYERKAPSASYSKEFINENKIDYNKLPFIFAINFQNGTMLTEENIIK